MCDHLSDENIDKAITHVSGLIDNLDQKFLKQVLDYLNSALAADPAAVSGLVTNRFACNKALADHPHVVVDGSPPDDYRVGALGLLNGLLTTFEMPKVAYEFDSESPHIVKRFVPYQEP